jgi:hypothetical protein
MKRNQIDNIDYLIGWLCGAVFVVAPVVAIVYLRQHRWRPAFQAGLICIISLSCIIGARALVLAAGAQGKRFVWIGINSAAFLIFPLIATAIASSISWPRATGSERLHS